MKNRLCFAFLIAGLLASVLVWDRVGPNPPLVSNDVTTGAQSLAGGAAASAELSRSVGSQPEDIGALTGSTQLVACGQEFWHRRSVGERPGSFDLSEVIERVSHAISPSTTT